MAVSAIFLSSYAIVPKTELNTRFSKVTNVERTDSSLRLRIRLQNFPNYWVKVPASTHLIAVGDTTRQYKIIGSENLPIDQEIWMPTSGYHDGTLIFENVPDEVKIVDMVESDPADVKNNILGIHLDEEETRVAPRLITMSDIMNNDNTASEKWTGLDPKRYSDMSFYDKDGKAHLEGRITDYTPRCGFNTFSMRVNDDFTGSKKMNVGNINPDGSFEIDIPLTYPQFNYFQLGNIHKNIFIIPGDTLSITTCLASRIDPDTGYVPEYFGFEGNLDDAVVINMLADSLIEKRYPISSLWQDYRVEQSDSMKSETYRSNARLGELLDSVVTDLPVLLWNIPVSTFAKDMLSSHAIGKICEMMEDLEMDFRDAKGPGYKPDENGEYSYHDGEYPDLAELISTRLKYKDLVYNNPLLFCNDWVLPNRWEFNGLFSDAMFVSSGFTKSTQEEAYVEAEDYEIPTLYKAHEYFLDSIGVGNCFVDQWALTKGFIRNFNQSESPSSKKLERLSHLITPLIRHNDCQKLNDILMSEYIGFIKKVLISENALANDNEYASIYKDTPEWKAFEKVIAPYKGNVLFLDFWGIGCGPCRAGMIHDKPLLEELADKPFKALYIANAEEGIDECKKWLKKEDIKGEHIFVAGDDWKRLSGLFNFSGIPHGVLVGKDGKVINPDYHFYKDEPQFKKALEE